MMHRSIKNSHFAMMASKSKTTFSLPYSLLIKIIRHFDLFLYHFHYAGIHFIFIHFVSEIHGPAIVWDIPRFSLV